MKTVLRSYFTNTLALYLTSQIASGMIFGNGLVTLFKTGFFLALTTLIVKPIINLLLLPLNLITFGIFRWISSTISLYLITLVISEFSINSFSFQGLSSYWLDIPKFNINGIIAFVGFSFLISAISSLIHWIFK